MVKMTPDTRVALMIVGGAALLMCLVYFAWIVPSRRASREREAAREVRLREQREARLLERRILNVIGPAVRHGATESVLRQYLGDVCIPGGTDTLADVVEAYNGSKAGKGFIYIRGDSLELLPTPSETGQDTGTLHDYYRANMLTAGAFKAWERRMRRLGHFSNSSREAIRVAVRSELGQEGQRKARDAERKARDALTNDVIGAKVYAQKVVTRLLKSPSTASFGGLFNDNPKAVPRGNGTYRVHGWVDSQNAFGATVRIDFDVTVEKLSVDTWRVVNVGRIEQR